MARRPPITPTEIQCSGETHVLNIDRHGRLLLDTEKHDVDLERALGALGGEMSECVTTLDDWEAGRVRHLTAELQIKMHEAYRPLLAKAEEALELADYRRPSDRWVDRAGTKTLAIIVPPGREHFSSETSKAWHSKSGKRKYPGTKLELVIYISIPSYKKVLRVFKDGLVRDKKGNDVAVVAIVNKNKDGTLQVVAGKQLLGFSIAAEHAIVVPTDDGYALKRWL